MEVAGLYAPEGKQSGFFLDGVTPLDLRMHQCEATPGFKYEWDEPPAALKLGARAAYLPAGSGMAGSAAARDR